MKTFGNTLYPLSPPLPTATPGRASRSLQSRKAQNGAHGSPPIVSAATASTPEPALALQPGRRIDLAERLAAASAGSAPASC